MNSKIIYYDVSFLKIEVLFSSYRMNLCGQKQIKFIISIILAYIVSQNKKSIKSQINIQYQKKMQQTNQPQENQQTNPWSSPSSKTIPTMPLPHYHNFLKQYRMTIKPPVKEDSIKYQLCQLFDQSIIKRTLKDISQFIRLEKRRKISDNKDELQGSGSGAQWKLKKRNSLFANEGLEGVGDWGHPKTVGEIIDKVILYTWQVANLRIILIHQHMHSNNSNSNHQSHHPFSIPQQTALSIHRFCISTCHIYLSKCGVSHKTMQSMLITYYNLLKNKIFDVDPQRNGSICCLIEAVLGDTQGELCNRFLAAWMGWGQSKGNGEGERQGDGWILQDSKTEPGQDMGEKKDYSPNKKRLIQALQKQQKKIQQQKNTQLQLQWFILILQYCLNSYQFFIRSTYTQLSNGNTHLVTHSGISFLHFISLLLNKIINDRNTTEIVKGYSCTIEDVKQMYGEGKQDKESKSQKSRGIRFTISWGDYQWLLDQLFPEVYSRYKQEIGKIWQHHAYPQGHTHPYNPAYIQCIMMIISFINCSIFLGGYIPILQKKTAKLILNQTLQFLQLSYLIYQLSHAKKSNIQMKVQEACREEFISNLEELLGLGMMDGVRITQESRKNKEEIEGNQAKNFKQEKQDKQRQLKLKQQKQQKQNQKKQQKQKQQQKLQSKIPIGQLKNLLPLQQSQLVCILRLLCNLVHINEQAQQGFQQNLKYFRIIMSLTHQCESQLTMKNWAIVFLKNCSERSSVMRGELEKLKIDVKVDQGDVPFI